MMVRTFQTYFSIFQLFFHFGFLNCKIADLNNAADPFTASFSLSRWINDALRPPAKFAETPSSETATPTSTATPVAEPKVLCEDRGSWLFSYPASGRVNVISLPQMVEDSTGNTYLLTMGNQNPGNAINFNTSTSPEPNQVLLVKLDPKGSVQWSFFLGIVSNSENQLGNLVLTDNGVIVASTVTDSFSVANSGSTFQGTSGTRNIGVFEVSSSGVLLRGRYIGNANSDFRAVDIVRNASKEYLILAKNNDNNFLPSNAGPVRSAPSTNSTTDTAYVISLSSTLTPNWYTVFGGGTENITPYRLFQSTSNENIWIFGIGRNDPDSAYNNPDAVHPGPTSDRHMFLAGFNSNGNYVRHRFLGQNGTPVNDNIVFRGTQVGDVAFVGAMHTGTYIISPTTVRAYAGPGREHTSFAFSLTNGSIVYNTFHGREQSGYLGGMRNTGLGRSVISMTKELDPGVGVSYPGGRTEYVAQVDTSGAVSRHSFLSIGSTSFNTEMILACDGSLTYGEVDFNDKTAPTAFQTKIQKLSRAAYPIPRPYRKNDGTIEYRED